MHTTTFTHRMFLLLSALLLLSQISFAARHKQKVAVTREDMKRVYDEVRTPYKYGMVVAPADNGHKIDCPTVFREGNRWLMTYVVYNGFAIILYMEIRRISSPLRMKKVS